MILAPFSGPMFWPHVHKAFRNQDPFQGQVKHYFTMDFFETYFLTIDFWYFIKYIPQARLLGILSFYERKGKFKSYMYSTPIPFEYKTTFTLSMYTMY